MPHFWFPRCGAAVKDAAFSSVLWREGQPAVSNKAYFYLQYLTCIFVVMITARMFGKLQGPGMRIREILSPLNPAGYLLSLCPAVYCPVCSPCRRRRSHVRQGQRLHLGLSGRFPGIRPVSGRKHPHPFDSLRSRSEFLHGNDIVSYAAVQGCGHTRCVDYGLVRVGSRASQHHFPAVRYVRRGFWPAGFLQLSSPKHPVDADRAAHIAVPCVCFLRKAKLPWRSCAKLPPRVQETFRVGMCPF